MIESRDRTSPRRPATLRSALVIDDHPLFCEALTMTLQAGVGVSDIVTAERLSEALALLEAGPEPDVILLDLNLPDVNGLDGLIRLKRAAPGAPVLVVSSMADDGIVSLAIRAGAAGFVPKHSRTERFRDALNAVAAGEIYLPETCAHLGKDQPRADAADAVDRLSALTLQQARILELVCAGKLNKQIAYELSIAETTVKAHMTAILRKLGVQSRTQAVLLASCANFTELLRGGGREA
ncbi:MAG: response regulator [Pikeienuella sp.]|uniref:response regulator n=1 Tax=Pikeienuella sp. TaxID=2831957 RepID=UPI00391B6C93